MWWRIFYYIVSCIVSALLAPKPPNAKASSLGDIQTPTAEEGRTITKILGTCKISGPNCVWSGDLKTQAIKVSSSGFFGIGARSQTIGHRYFLGMQLALTVGKIDELVDILVGDKSLGVSAAYSDAGTVLHVDKCSLFGGDRQEGGISGDLAFYFGSGTQQGDSYLQGVLGTPVPGYRGVCHAVLRRMYLGTSPYLKDWAFILRATPAPAGLSALWANINGDANPSYGIAEILTCEVEDGGMGVPASRLDLSSFSAAAQTLYQEGFGISFQMNNEQAAEEYLEDICRTINAVLYTDPSTGLWTLKLVRQDYDPATLPEFGPDALQEDPEITWPSWPETINKVVVRYVSREGFTTRTVQDRDTGNRAIQGVDVMTTLDFLMVSNATVAQMVVGRERRSCAYPLAALRLVFNRRAWALRPGSAFKFNYPPMGIQGLICRGANIRYGRLGDAKITVEAAEDIFAAVPATYTPPPASGWVDPLGDPVPAAQQALIEAPYWLVAENRHVLVLAARGDATTQSMDVYADSGSGYLQADSLETPTPTGLLTAAWSCRTAALDPTGITVGSGVDLDHLPAYSTDAAGRNQGANLALIGGTEWVSWTTATDNGDGTYAISGVLRGVLDTVPVDHAAGERVWFASQGCALLPAATTSGGVGSQGPTGGEGPKGDSLVLAGTWDPTVQYETFQIVTRAGGSYVAIQASFNCAPELYPAYWQVIAKQGDAGVSTFTRTTVSDSTGSLGVGSSANLDLTIRKTAALRSLQTDYPAWVRVYGSASQRLADAGRLITVDHESGIGCYLDASTKSTDLDISFDEPVPIFTNNDSNAVDTAYISVINIDTQARDITVTLSYLPLEA